ncbi:NAD(P)-dependent oxidoreductase [Candidatus Woesearchaeota archaeon]|nr:NAD(P)-dependent oxidoreductase [Candidatus Woesearchaeota archaeon]
MKQTILLGGSGFMGPHILSLDPSILSIGRSPPPSWVTNRHIAGDPIANPEILDTLEFDRVIFLIGNSNHHAINSGKIDAFSYNVYPLKKFLSCIASRGIKQFLAFSTILMYDPKKMELPVSEGQPISPYANEYVFSKYVAEQMCEYYRKFMPIINIRMSNVYGPIMLDRPDLVPTMVKSLLSKGTCEILSDKPVRDFIYVKDAASAFLKLLKADFSGTVNMGTGEMHSVRDVCHILETISGKRIKVLSKPVEGHQKFCCDMAKLKSIISWKPGYTIEQGLKETYETMKAWMGK